MKCPKCGFTSFDTLQECKKCGIDLSAHKSKFSLLSLLRAPAPVASSPALEETFPEVDEPAATATDAVDFGYDFMEEESRTEPAQAIDDLLADTSVQQASTSGFDLDSPSLQNKDTPGDALDLSGTDDTSFDMDTNFTWDEVASDPAEQSLGRKEIEEDFELPSMNDLPPLDDLDQSGSDADDFIDLPEFDEIEAASLNPRSKTEPRDPFEAGGDADERRPPASAPLALRFRASVVDAAVLGIAFALFLSAAEMIVQGGFFPSAETILALIVPYSLIFFLLCFGYFTLFHALTGQTVGKMLLGLRVETLEGNPILFSQAFLRAVGGVLCLIPLGLGFLHILSASEGRGLNDRLAGTRVVLLQEGQEEEAEKEETGDEQPAQA